MSNSKTTQQTSYRVRWSKVNSELYRSDVGLLKHTRRGWYWLKIGERAGRVGPFAKIREAQEIVYDLSGAAPVRDDLHG